MTDDLVVVRGGGDLATGTIHRLVKCGFRVVVLEVEQPTVIRRTVAFAQAIFDGEAIVEDVQAVRIENVEQVKKAIYDNKIPILVDPMGEAINALKPKVVIDAIIAKRNLGTYKGMAPIVIGLGPGFTAGVDVDAVVETNRGHNLGRVIYYGNAEPNTGSPGEIGGFSKERIIRSPCSGVISAIAKIGDKVKKGDIVAYVEDIPVLAPLDGVLRGLIQDGVSVESHLKIGDVDPRDVKDHCFTISDKARAIAGGVLEAILYLRNHGDGSSAS